MATPNPGVFGVGALSAVITGTLLTCFFIEQLFLVLAGLGVGAATLGGILVSRGSPKSDRNAAS